MEISKKYAKELAKQERRKADLLDTCEATLSQTNRILFEPGCGHGHWLTNYAQVNPKQVCVGIDLISHRIRKGKEKAAKRKLDNIYFIKADLGEFLEVLPVHIRFDKTILLFPDPWPKARHHRRRMVQTALLDSIAVRTDPGGTFCFRSDDRAYYDWTIEHLENHPLWKIDLDAKWPHESDTYFQNLMTEFLSVIARRTY